MISAPVLDGCITHLRMAVRQWIQQSPFFLSPMEIRHSMYRALQDEFSAIGFYLCTASIVTTHHTSGRLVNLEPLLSVGENWFDESGQVKNEEINRRSLRVLPLPADEVVLSIDVSMQYQGQGSPVANIDVDLYAFCKTQLSRCLAIAQAQALSATALPTADPPIQRL